MGQHTAACVQPLAVLPLVPPLLDLAFTVLRGHCHGERIAHELRCELGDAFRVGGRKQQSLPRFGALLGDFHDVVEKAHVEHAVGFV